MAKQSTITCSKKLLIIIFFIALIAVPLMMTHPVSALANGYVRRAIFENWTFSPSLYAQKADLYMCHVEKASKIQQIHQIRSDVICLIYRNLRSVAGGSSDYQTALTNKWILKDANGILIHGTQFNEYIIDKGNAGYQTWVANWIKTNLDKYGANGVFADCVFYSTIGEMCWGTNWKEGTAGPPINPRTGKLYIDAEQKSAEIALIDKIKATIGSRLVIGNGVFNGERFFQREYDDILLGSKVDGLMSEAWISTRGSTEWYSEAKWLESIKFTTWLETNFLKSGKIFMPISENAQTNSYDTTVLPSGCTKEQYVTYCFGSLLLGVSSNTHYLNLGYYMPEDYPQSLFNIGLGTPQTSYYVVSGTHVYARDFSNYKVLVNPTSSSYQVTLSGQYETFDGKAVTSPLTLAGHRAAILKKIGSVPPPPPPPPPTNNTLFQSSFETGSFSEWDGTTVTSGETASVVQTLPHDGTYNARFRTDGGSSTARAYARKNLAATSELHTSAYMYIDSGLPLSSWRSLWLMQFCDASGSVVASYGIQANTQGTRWALLYGSQTVFAASGPQLDRWYLFDAYFKKASSGKTLTIYVDGQEVASLTVNTSAESDVTQVRVGITYNSAGYTFTIYADTVAMYKQATSSTAIFESSFETGNFGEWTGTSTTSGETATVVQTLPRDGAYDARFRTDGGSTSARAYCYKNIASTTELYTLAYVYIDSGLPLNNYDALWLFQLQDSSGSNVASYGIKADKTGAKWALLYGSQTVYASSAPQMDTWYAVEIFFKKATTGETLAIYVNGQKVASLTVNTSGASNIAQVRLGIAYNSPGYMFNIYVDDVTIDDQYIQP